MTACVMGFGIPANATCQRAPGPASESRQRTKPRGVGHPADQRAMGNWLAPLSEHGLEDGGPGSGCKRRTPKRKPGRMPRGTRLRRNGADSEPLRSDFAEPPSLPAMDQPFEHTAVTIDAGATARQRRSRDAEIDGVTLSYSLPLSTCHSRFHGKLLSLRTSFWRRKLTQSCRRGSLRFDARKLDHLDPLLGF
jgi:hypothetical protein